MSSSKTAAPVERIIKQASAAGKRIGLPEATDPRMLEAASELMREGICTPVLIGTPEQIQQAANEAGIKLPEGIEIQPIDDLEKLDRYATQLFEKRKHKGLDKETALSMMKKPLWFADFMLSNNELDGCLAGAVHTTGDVIRAAIQSVGVAKKGGMVSSCFLMILPDGREITYADCAVIPYPDEQQLAGIAVDAAETHRKLTGQEPVVAMLSFSTKGSAAHERVELVSKATALAKEMAPDLKIDGEFQFDAAFVPDIGNRKAPDSEIAGRANVFVFPNLDAGNIGYKITERVGGAIALGPVLQGLASPVNDLSRGCSAGDIVLMSAITSLLAE